jgi:hypothetical protein
MPRAWKAALVSSRVMQGTVMPQLSKALVV